MPFIPTLSVTVEGRCTSLIITDTTGADTGDGTKWDGVAGLASATLTAASFSITGPDGSNTAPNVLSQITGAAPITGDLTFTGITGTWTDGLYDIRYSVTGTAALTDFEFYLYCNAQNCVDAMFAKLSTLVCTDTAASKTRDRLLDNAMMAEGLLMALKSAIASSSTTALDYILARINRICTFEGCGTCSDCT
jgi:hypothetical protein